MLQRAGGRTCAPCPPRTFSALRHTNTKCTPWSTGACPDGERAAPIAQHTTHVPARHADAGAAPARACAVRCAPASAAAGFRASACVRGGRGRYSGKGQRRGKIDPRKTNAAVTPTHRRACCACAMLFWRALAGHPHIPLCLPHFYSLFLGGFRRAPRERDTDRGQRLRAAAAAPVHVQAHPRRAHVRPVREGPLLQGGPGLPHPRAVQGPFINEQ